MSMDMRRTFSTSLTEPPDYTSNAPDSPKTPDSDRPLPPLPPRSPNHTSRSPTSRLPSSSSSILAPNRRLVPAPLQAGEDVVLSWDPTEPFNANGGTTILANASTPSLHTRRSSTTSSSLYSPPLPLPVPPVPSIPYVQGVTEPPPAIEPPSYIEARAPTVPVMYTFSQSSPNSMLLLPPPDSPDTRPLYHISVVMNCFCPESCVTTIRKGASELDPGIGDFEMGGATYKETVSIRGKEFPLRTVVHREGPSFKWNIISKQHVWTPESTSVLSPELKKRKVDKMNLPPPIRCTSKDKKVLYAKFFPAVDLREPGKMRMLSRLYVEPVVHKEKLMDDIVVSCLVVERWRQLILMGRGHAVGGS